MSVSPNNAAETVESRRCYRRKALQEMLFFFLVRRDCHANAKRKRGS